VPRGVTWPEAGPEDAVAGPFQGGAIKIATSCNFGTPQAQLAAAEQIICHQPSRSNRSVSKFEGANIAGRFNLAYNEFSPSSFHSISMAIMPGEHAPPMVAPASGIMTPSSRSSRSSYYRNDFGSDYQRQLHCRVGNSPRAPPPATCRQQQQSNVQGEGSLSYLECPMRIPRGFVLIPRSSQERSLSVDSRGKQPESTRVPSRRASKHPLGGHLAQQNHQANRFGGVNAKGRFNSAQTRDSPSIHPEKATFAYVASVGIPLLDIDSAAASGKNHNPTSNSAAPTPRQIVEGRQPLPKEEKKARRTSERKLGEKTKKMKADEQKKQEDGDKMRKKGRHRRFFSLPTFSLSSRSLADAQPPKCSTGRRAEKKK